MNERERDRLLREKLELEWYFGYAADPDGFDRSFDEADVFGDFNDFEISDGPGWPYGPDERWREEWF